MTEKVRLIVAGAGAFGREHLRVLFEMPGAELAGIADPNLVAARDAAARFGSPEIAADARELIDRLRPDGVVVATPAAAHVAIARHALSRAIPVLVEKPVAPTRAEAAELVAAGAGTRGFVLPGHILRFSDAHRRLVEIVRSNAIGPILSLTARRHRDDSHALRYADDPVLMTMIHDIDLALWITGATLAEAFAFRRPEGAQRSETLVTARDTRGAVWRLSTAWTFPAGSCPPDRIEIIGENGSAELEVGAAIRIFGAAPQEIDISGGDPDQALKAELAYFMDCIRTGRKPAAVTLDDALAGLAASDAIIASLRTGGAVRP